MMDLDFCSVMLQELIRDDFYTGQLTIKVKHDLNNGWWVEVGDCAASSPNFFQALVQAIAMAKRKPV